MTLLRPTGTRSVTLVADLRNEQSADGQGLRVLLQPPADGLRVTWAADVVDNEHLGRHKSNCCCIYRRPRNWDDPDSDSSDSEDETPHCRGHTLPTPPPPPPPPPRA